MSANSNITDLYERIRKELFYMIPEKWEWIYLYASVVQRENRGGGGGGGGGGVLGGEKPDKEKFSKCISSSTKI